MKIYLTKFNPVQAGSSELSLSKCLSSQKDIVLWESHKTELTVFLTH
jgi:hypothetical protein